MEEVRVVKIEEVHPSRAPRRKIMSRPLPLACRYAHRYIYYEQAISEEDSYDVSLTDGCLSLARPHEEKKNDLLSSEIIQCIPQIEAPRCARHANVDQLSRSSHSDEERGLYDLPERFQMVRLDSGSVSERQDDSYIKSLLKKNKKKCLYALGYVVCITVFALSFPLARHFMAN